MSEMVSPFHALIPDDGAGATPPTFSAPVIGHWSSDAVVLDGSNRVQTWTDLSGNGNDLTQAVAGSRGRYFSAPGLKGRYAVEGDGAASFWANTAMKVGGLDPPAYAEYTLIMLARSYRPDPGHAFCAASIGSGVDATGVALKVIPTGGQVLWFSVTDAFPAMAPYPHTGSDAFTRWHYYVGRQSSAQRSLSVDGGAPVVGVGAENPAALRRFYLGRLSGGSYFFVLGAIARAWLLGGDVTEAELQSLAVFMREYYGVAA